MIKLNRNRDSWDFLLSFMFVLRLPAVFVMVVNGIEGSTDSAPDDAKKVIDTVSVQCYNPVTDTASECKRIKEERQCQQGNRRKSGKKRS